MAKKKSKVGVSMFSLSILPNPSKDLKLFQKLEFIKEAFQREEVLQKQVILTYHEKYGTEATVSALKPYVGGLKF